VHQKSELIDRILKFCCKHFIGEKYSPGFSLVAVGGYGRRELLPGSDIDLMILLDRKPGKSLEEKISTYLTFLCDIGLEVGHSVRTVKDCVREGKSDVTVITNMIESRLICGTEKLYEKFQKAIGPTKMW